MMPGRQLHHHCLMTSSAKILQGYTKMVFPKTALTLFSNVQNENAFKVYYHLFCLPGTWTS